MLPEPASRPIRRKGSAAGVSVLLLFLGAGRAAVKQTGRRVLSPLPGVQGRGEENAAERQTRLTNVGVMGGRGPRGCKLGEHASTRGAARNRDTLVEHGG